MHLLMTMRVSQVLKYSLFLSPPNNFSAAKTVSCKQSRVLGVM